MEALQRAWWDDSLRLPRRLVGEGWLTRDIHRLSHLRRTAGRTSAEQTFRVEVDAKRRPTLPQSLLDAAGVGGGQDLIAHLEAPGRIVLEGRATVLARLQAAVRAGKDERGVDVALADELLAERAGDASLDDASPEPER